MEAEAEEAEEVEAEEVEAEDEDEAEAEESGFLHVNTQNLPRLDSLHNYQCRSKAYQIEVKYSGVRTERHQSGFCSGRLRASACGRLESHVRPEVQLATANGARTGCPTV